jgi:hypothetical protein
MVNNFSFNHSMKLIVKRTQNFLVYIQRQYVSFTFILYTTIMYYIQFFFVQRQKSFFLIFLIYNMKYGAPAGPKPYYPLWQLSTANYSICNNLYIINAYPSL